MPFIASGVATRQAEHKSRKGVHCFVNCNRSIACGAVIIDSKAKKKRVNSTNQEAAVDVGPY